MPPYRHSVDLNLIHWGKHARGSLCVLRDIDRVSWGLFGRGGLPIPSPHALKLQNQNTFENYSGCFSII